MNICSSKSHFFLCLGMAGLGLLDALGLTVHVSNCRFFRQWLVLLAMHQMALGLFRLLASVARVMIVAQTGGSFAIIVVFVLGGFIVSRGTSFSIPLQQNGVEKGIKHFSQFTMI